MSPWLFWVPFAAVTAAAPPAQGAQPISGAPQHVLALSPDGTRLAASDGRCLRLYDVATGKELNRAPMEPDRHEECGALAFAPDGHQLASVDGPLFGYDTMTITLYPVSAAGRLGPARHLRPPEPRLGAARVGVDHAAFSPDGRSVAAGTHEGEVRVWDAADGGQRLN